jgi:hypothetical protein
MTAPRVIEAELERIARPQMGDAGRGQRPNAFIMSKGKSLFLSLLLGVGIVFWFEDFVAEFPCNSCSECENQNPDAEKDIIRYAFGAIIGSCVGAAAVAPDLQECI